jgi:serine/threonine protein kinase
MAPELLAAQPATPACDLYSLGIMMAEMMAGTSVYRGSPIEVCMLVLAPEPVPLPEIVLSSRLAPVIQRATMKNPAERYASAQAMMGDLHTALGGLLGPRRSRSDTGMRAVQVPQQSAPPIHVPESAAPMPAFRSTVPPTSAMPSQSSLPPRRRQRSSGALKLVLLLVAGLLFGALIVAGAFFIMKYRQASEQATIEPTVTSMPPSRFEKEALKTKLGRLGYKLDSETGTTLYATNGDRNAIVALRELLGPNDDSAVEARRREGSAVAREGQWALDVRVEKNRAIDAAAGAELLAGLAPP